MIQREKRRNDQQYKWMKIKKKVNIQKGEENCLEMEVKKMVMLNF